jgi:hypothetical protein
VRLVGGGHSLALRFSRLLKPNGFRGADASQTRAQSKRAEGAVGDVLEDAFMADTPVLSELRHGHELFSVSQQIVYGLVSSR